MSERRIVQIAGAGNEYSVYALALADDGSVWLTSIGAKSWVLMPALPASQDAKEARDA